MAARPGQCAARYRRVIECSYPALVILHGEILVAASARREQASPIEILVLSGLLGSAARRGMFEHALDCLFGDDDPLAEAEGRQPAGASHFIG